MIECPECGKHVRGTKCSCGWDVPQARPIAQGGGDPMYGCCEWVADGRCHFPGVFSAGNGTPWYCREHDGCTDPVVGAEIVERSHRDIPHPDYSYAARKSASLQRVAKDAEAWGNRFKEAA